MRWLRIPKSNSRVLILDRFLLFIPYILRRIIPEVLTPISSIVVIISPDQVYTGWIIYPKLELYQRLNCCTLDYFIQEEHIIVLALYEVFREENGKVESSFCAFNVVSHCQQMSAVSGNDIAIILNSTYTDTDTYI